MKNLALFILLFFAKTSHCQISKNQFQIGFGSDGIMPISPIDFHLFTGTSIGIKTQRHELNTGIYLFGIQDIRTSVFKHHKFKSGYINYTYNFTSDQHPRHGNHIETAIGTYQFDSVHIENYSAPFEVGTKYQGYFFRLGFGHHFQIINNLTLKLTPSIGYYLTKTTDLRTSGQYFNKTYSKTTYTNGSLSLLLNISVHYSF